MRKRFLLIASILLIGAVSLAACGKKSPSSPESETTTEDSSEKASSEEVSSEETSAKEDTVATEKTTTAATEAVKKTDTATKEDEKAKPKSGSGIFSGWADSNSVEIQMSNGEYKTFFVEDEDVKATLNKKGEGSKISFTYGALEGQANMQILSVK